DKFYILLQATSIRETSDIMQFEPLKENADAATTITSLITCERRTMDQIKTLKALIAPCVAPKFRGTLHSPLAAYEEALAEQTLVPERIEFVLPAMLDGPVRKLQMSSSDVRTHHEESLSPALLDVGLRMVINGLRKKIDLLRTQAGMPPIHSGTVDARPSVDGTVDEALQLVADIPSRSGWAFMPVRTGLHWRLLLVRHGDATGDGSILVLDPAGRPSDDATMGETLEWEGRKFILEPTMFGKIVHDKWAEWLSGDLLLKYMSFIMPALAMDITVSRALEEWPDQMDGYTASDPNIYRSQVILGLLSASHLLS
ncbi:hypothetical protein HWV62_1935, partial [Athelia sp. TMB]